MILKKVFFGIHRTTLLLKMRYIVLENPRVYEFKKLDSFEDNNIINEDDLKKKLAIQKRQMEMNNEKNKILMNMEKINLTINSLECDHSLLLQLPKLIYDLLKMDENEKTKIFLAQIKPFLLKNFNIFSGSDLCLILLSITVIKEDIQDYFYSIISMIVKRKDNMNFEAFDLLFKANDNLKLFDNKKYLELHEIIRTQFLDKILMETKNNLEFLTSTVFYMSNLEKTNYLFWSEILENLEKKTSFLNLDQIIIIMRSFTKINVNDTFKLLSHKVNIIFLKILNKIIEIGFRSNIFKN